MDHGEKVPEIAKSKYDQELKEGKTFPTIDPEDLIEHTFLKEPEEDGQHFCVKIIEAIANNQHDLAERKENIKFRCSVDDGHYEEIVSYNDIIDHIENDQTDHGIWKFKSITPHQGPLSAGDKSYMGSMWNVLVNWETGESTYEPLHINAADDPVTRLRGPVAHGRQRCGVARARSQPGAGKAVARQTQTERQPSV